MSFSDSNNADYKEDLFQGQTCCTVFLTFNGELAGGITRCMPGTDQTAEDLACLAASNAAKKFINENVPTLNP
jgi:hypothetical protein